MRNMFNNLKIAGFILGVVIYLLLCISIQMSYEVRLSVGLVLFIVYLTWLFLRKN